MAWVVFNENWEVEILPLNEHCLIYIRNFFAFFVDRFMEVESNFARVYGQDSVDDLSLSFEALAALVPVRVLRYLVDELYLGSIIPHSVLQSKIAHSFI